MVGVHDLHADHSVWIYASLHEVSCIFVVFFDLPRLIDYIQAGPTKSNSLDKSSPKSFSIVISMKIS